jgi:hypothetical protein
VARLENKYQDSFRQWAGLKITRHITATLLLQQSADLSAAAMCRLANAENMYAALSHVHPADNGIWHEIEHNGSLQMLADICCSSSC